MRSKSNKPGGRIRLAARAVNCAGEVIVGNAGDGIPKERAAQLFERFYQTRGDKRAVGHRLGLSTARELTRAHGGDVILVGLMSVGQSYVHGCP